VERYLSRPGATVVATTRSASAPAADALRRLGESKPGRLVVTELDAGDEASIASWAAALAGEHGVAHVDVRARAGRRPPAPPQPAGLGALLGGHLCGLQSRSAAARLPC
jgi:hypothetical protein